MNFIHWVLLLYGCFINYKVKTQISSYEDINDFFESSFQDNQTLPEIPNTYFKNFTIDIENIDPQRIRRKFETLQSQITKNEEKLNNSRRQTLYFTGYTRGRMHRASEYMTRTKLADLMLQTIYMARHKLRELEDDPDYNVQDPGFRVGYLYQKLRNIFIKVRSIKHKLGNMTKYGLVQSGEIYETIGPGIILHTKAVRLYIDFVYLFKVLLNIDQSTMKVFELKHKLPEGDTTGGFTDEDSSPVSSMEDNSTDTVPAG